MQIKLKKLNKSAVIPEYKTKGAACFDLVINTIYQPSPNLVEIGFGIASEIPEGFEVTVKPRSSFCHKHWVMQNSPGSIDSDYRGEWKCKLEAIPQIMENGESIVIPFPYTVGDRVCQAKLERVIIAEFVEVENLSETSRGDGGFGHTGIKQTHY